MRLRSRDLFATAHTEGGLLPADLLTRVADGDPDLPGLAPTDYHLAPGERLGEAVNRSWTRLLGAWRSFDEARRDLADGDPGARLTRERWLHPMFDELGYGRLVQQPAVELDGKSFPVFTAWQHTPIHLVGCGVAIDRRAAGVRGAAGQSPHSLVQELLNRSPERLWGIVTNGLVLRVLRDNVALTRQAYLQFDLEAMLSGEVYPDFVVMWLVCHQSRVEADRPEDCWLERWTRTAVADGTRALNQLRDGVREAIQTIGAGFLAHPANGDLHRQLRDGELAPEEYYRQLLRLVYRLLFLFVAEDRDALLDPGATPTARERYLAYYSTRGLRTLAIRRLGGRQHDRYEQLKLVMAALHEDGCPPLALPALGSYLWSPDAIGPLADAQLANEDLLAAIRSLSTIDEGVRRSVDFRNLGAEELGSVYEALLELHPTLDRTTARFSLAEVAGSERKTTGSYYTPTSLIASLLDTALEPVLDEAAGAADPERAILSLAVVDPACGSGHFLIAAANRIAKRLAAIRSEDPEPSPDELRAALRDVVGHCIHGVDVNPMAVELCKVSLWMEALEPGRPLSFLDHRIALGNSLLGATPELIADGIPAAAFKPILGDDRAFTTALRRRNEQESGGQLVLDLGDHLDGDALAIAEQAASLEGIDDHSLRGVREQQRRFQRLLDSPERRRARLAADTWCAAFVARKHSDATPITQDALVRALSGGEAPLSVDEQAVVAQADAEYAFLHWHVAFPAVWERGGFDVVLGNPPWEHTELKEKEFFATRAPEIASAPTGAARKRMIDALTEHDPTLFDAFEAAKRRADGVSHFVRNSGRYPMCGRGRINTYAVFAELMRGAIAPAGRAGVIVPTGIATDDTTKLYFQDVIQRRSLVSLYDFRTGAGLWAEIGHNRFKFCLLTLTGPARPATDDAEFAFFLLSVDDLQNAARRFTLNAQDIALLNPNTRTCPVFRSRRDAELTKQIYRRVPVLLREGDPDGNPWRITFKQGLFNMTSDSHLFRTREQLEPDGWTLEGNVFTRDGERYLPLYEGRLGHQFNHRFASQPNGAVHTSTTDELLDPNFVVEPAYWVTASDFQGALPGSSTVTCNALLGFRRVARTEDERTVIAALLPQGPASYGWILSLGPDSTHLAKLLTVFNSFAFDFCMRGKLSQPSIPQGTAAQCPTPLPAAVPQYVVPAALELSYTAVDLAPFAADLGYTGPPFNWDLDRRAVIRAEMDAAMFRLYGIERADIDYILDTFPIVRRRDEQRFGEYRTKRLILERYDAMVLADAAGREYETPLDPLPGKQRIEVRT